MGLQDDRAVNAFTFSSPVADLPRFLGYLLHKSNTFSAPARQRNEPLALDPMAAAGSFAR
jgi:hypothetical protein